MKHLLYLKIKSDPYKLECNLNGCGQGSCAPGELPDGSEEHGSCWLPNGVYGEFGDFTCAACQGTGMRQVRLIGMVKVREDSLKKFGFYYEPIIRVRAKLKDIIQGIEFRMRVNTLHPELMQSESNPLGLKEERIK